MPDLPRGTVTFLFTDIEGSTQLVQTLGDARAVEAFAVHHRLLRSAFAARGGRELEDQGDGFLVVFQRAQDAVLAAVAAQEAINVHPWPDDLPVRVRMGLHTGEPILAADGYVGLDIHRSARICQAGWGGQILLSHATLELTREDLPAAFGLRDLGEHRLKDLHRPERIYQLLHPNLPADFPPLKSLDSMPNNLPRSLSSFIGREREIAEVKRLLASPFLLTLTGPGGCGKTRLALQVAADLVEGYADGVWLVELAPLSDPTLVPEAVASALRVREQPGRPIIETLSGFLQPKTILLVLDNCEHLVAACARLADALLRTCPQLRILATSQEPLRIPGETIFRVPSLSVRDLDGLPSLESLTGNEAVRLFIERSRSALPAFTVTDHNAPLIAQVCRRLDGIPLAIELAAARVKVLPVNQIADRLDDRFRLLTGGSRTTLPRHQTLRSAMDWSYSLLSESERKLLRRLSVFARGWTLEAAEEVCTGSDLAQGEVLDLLGQLVDKSLVVVEEQAADGRYRLLETVRLYAREKLLEAGEDAELLRRHGEWFLALAERAEPKLQGPDQALWLGRLEAEHANLLVALEWSRSARPGSDVGLRLASALWRFWWMRGYLTEGRRWLEGLLKESRGAPAASRARGLIQAGRLAWAQSDYTAAGAFSEESLALSRALGDTQAVADALNTLGLVAWTRSDYPAARTIYEEGLLLSRELGDRRRTAVLLNNLGIVAETQGDYAASRERHEESLQIRRAIGDQHGVAYSLGNLGRVAALEGEYVTARTYFEEGLDICRDLGDKLGTCNLMNRLGLVAYRQGEVPRALSLSEESLVLARELGDKESIADTLCTLGRLAHHRGDMKRAMDLMHESLMLRRDLGDRPGIAECLEQLAAIALDRKDPERTAQLLGAADAIRHATGAPLPPADRVEYQRRSTVAHSELGAHRFEDAWTRGRAMPLEQAVAQGLEQRENSGKA